MDSIKVFDTQAGRRAVLYRQGAQAGVRTALWIALSPGLALEHPFHGLAGLWLVEPISGPLSCLGSVRQPSGRSVGGRVLRGLPLLDPEHPGTQALASALAGDGASEQQQQDEQRCLQQALDSFRAELDAQAIGAVQTDAVPSVEVYNHYRGQTALQSRNRIQAAQSHPAFAASLREHWPLRRSVDQGLPLIQQLAAHYRVRPATIKRARGLTAADGLQPTPNLLKQLDALSASSWPETSADWAVFTRVADGLQTLVEQAGLDRSAILKPFTGGWAKGLAAVEAQLQAPLDLDAILELMHCTYHYGVAPAVAEALRAGDEPTELAQTPPPGFFPLWFGRYGLGRLARLAQAWQEAHGRISLQQLAQGKRAPARKALSWPAYLETGATHGAFRVVELTSHAALELEGQRLEHCVASYAVKCLLAESAIFSIRTAAGVPCSTFEVHLSTTGAPELLQHHGPDNDPPSPTEREIARRFVDRVLVQLPAARLRSVQQTRRQLGRQVRGLLGEPDTMPEPPDSKTRAALGKAIASAHPAEARRQGLMPFLQAQGADVLAAMRAA